MGKAMKLALIPPIELLEYTDETDMQLMLPHLLGNDVYRYVYSKHCDDFLQWVILDNGAAEGEDNFSNKDLIDMALEFRVNELVIPDTLGDANDTRLKAYEFRDYLTTRTDLSEADLNFMFVAQGSNYDEFRESALWATWEDWIDVIGIPRHMIETCGSIGIRNDLVWNLSEITDKPFHLLGGSPLDPSELNDSWPTNVRSTDTSSPFNYAHTNFKLTDELDDIAVHVRRPEGYFDLSASLFPIDIVDHNIACLKRWTGDHS